MRIYLFVSLLAFFMTSCATANYYNKAIHTWQGAPADLLKEKWGEPDQLITLPNGNKLFVYVTKAPRYTPPPLVPAAVTSSGGRATVVAPSRPMSSEITLSCTTTFEVGRDNKIMSANFSGNNCPTDERFGQK